MDVPLWRLIWEQKLLHIGIFASFLILIFLLILFKDRISRNKGALNIMRYGILAFSFLYVGLFLKAQPTSTNIVIFFNALKDFEFPHGLYLMEPYIFLSFVFIFITMIFWGRGVFCGWLCPYGAMLELLNKLYKKVLPKARIEVPERVHNKLIYLKYVIFVIILGISFYNFILSEILTEVEPFRTFVLKLNREWYFILYFVILTLGSLVDYRAFCRYLCPLGASLAVPTFIKKMPIIKLKRYDFCSSCKICARGCEPGAISSEGVIDSRECLDCLDCQVNYWDANVCPVLIKKKREGSEG